MRLPVRSRPFNPVGTSTKHFSQKERGPRHAITHGSWTPALCSPRGQLQEAETALVPDRDPKHSGPFWNGEGFETPNDVRGHHPVIPGARADRDGAMRAQAAPELRLMHQRRASERDAAS
jgi:hypothetical protein